MVPRGGELFFRPMKLQRYPFTMMFLVAIASGIKTAEVFTEAEIKTHTGATVLHGPDSPIKGATTLQARGMIFHFCIGMYATLALIWFLYSMLEAANIKNRAFLETSRVTLLAISWTFMSIGATVINKTLVTSLQAPALITVIQMAITVLAVAWHSWKPLISTEGRVLRYWFIVPWFYAIVLCSGTYTLKYFSLSMMMVMRNLMPLVVLPIEYLVAPRQSRPVVTPWVVLSIVIPIVGTLLYVRGVHSVSSWGIVFAVCNIIGAMADRLIQRRLLTVECKDLESTVCTLINNAVGIIPTFVVALASHQVAEVSDVAQRSAGWSDPFILSMLVLSGFLGYGMAYFGLECQRAITATSFFVLQNFSKVGVIGTGIMFFGDPVNSGLTVVGLVLSVVGSVLYGLATQAAKLAEASLGEKAGLLRKEKMASSA